MGTSRLDRLLAELKARYELSDSFLDRLRPQVETILSDEVAEGHRVGLLEKVAETCQRDHQLRTSAQGIKDSLHEMLQWLELMKGYLGKLTDRKESQEGEASS